MRAAVENPVGPEQLARATQLAEQIYMLYEAGRDWDQTRADLSRIVGCVVATFDVHAAFGSVDPAGFAHDLLARSAVIPTDLSHVEMLELVQCLLEPRSGERRTSFWLACLAENTGNPKFSSLIYWPGSYFGDGDNSRELSAEEVLRIAMADGSRGVA